MQIETFIVYPAALTAALVHTLAHGWTVLAVVPESGYTQAWAGLAGWGVRTFRVVVQRAVPCSRAELQAWVAGLDTLDKAADFTT